MIDLTLEDSQDASPIVKKENPEQISQGLLIIIKCFYSTNFLEHQVENNTNTNNHT